MRDFLPALFNPFLYQHTRNSIHGSKKKKKKGEKDASVCSETESLERVCLARFENNSYLKIM